jgi:AP-1 complex subunit beta-1
VYWRLLSSDPEAARSIVLAEKPVIAQTSATMDPQLLATLLGSLSTLSSVYHLPPSV